jgi:hypothetical protein
MLGGSSGSEAPSSGVKPVHVVDMQALEEKIRPFCADGVASGGRRRRRC